MAEKKKGKIQKPNPVKAVKAADEDAKRLPLYIALILAVTVIVMSPAFKNELVSWDDYAYIVNNPVIQVLSAKNIRHIFDFKTEVVGNYHPLTVLSLAIEYKISGVKPFLYHFDNILLHLLNIILVACIVWLLTKHFYTVLIASALFALHPMRVESVVWAAERKDVLYSFFFLLAMLQYIRYVTGGRKVATQYIASLLFFVLSILSKGQAVVLAGVLVLIDYWYDGKFIMKRWLGKIPFFGLALLFGYLATLAQSSSLTEQRLAQHTFIDRLFFANYNLVAYVYKLIAPFSLACFYGYPGKSDMVTVYLSPLIVIGVLAWLFIRLRNNKTVVFGTLFFIGTISIVIQLLPIGNAIIADRYTYIPYLGLFIIIGEIVNRYISMPAKRGVTTFVCILILLVFSVKTYLQAATWKNSETLFLTVLKNDPNEPTAHNNLGAYYLDQQNYPQAIDHFRQSIANRERYTEAFKAYGNLGKALSESGQPDQAIEAYSKSIEIAPELVDGYFGRGLTWSLMKQYDKAVADFDTVIKMQPGHAKAWYSRGLADKGAGRLEAAISDYSNAVRIDPVYSEAYMNRGNVYFLKNDHGKAIEDYNIAIRLNPGDGTALLNRSKSLFFLKKIREAYEDAKKAQDLGISDPGFIQALEQSLQGSSGN